jgi:hypothetical protein
MEVNVTITLHTCSLSPHQLYQLRRFLGFVISFKNLQQPLYALEGSKNSGFQLSRQSEHEALKVVSLHPQEISLALTSDRGWSISGPLCGRKVYGNENFQRYHLESNPQTSCL